MRSGRLLLAATWLALGMTPVRAQVTTNDSALDALGKPEPHRPAPRRAPARPAPQKPVAEQPPPAPAKTPSVPVTPPAILALPPPVVVPLANPPPTPAIPVADDAPGEATPIKDGVRITFGAERADLSPATVAVLRDFARDKLGQTQTSINIYAYAAGTQEDPSTPRRLSFARALAARAVLLHEGIPSPRIYPRALGPLGGDVLPDRIDVVAGAPTPPSQAPAKGPAG